MIGSRYQRHAILLLGALVLSCVGCARAAVDARAPISADHSVHQSDREIVARLRARHGEQLAAASAARVRIERAGPSMRCPEEWGEDVGMERVWLSVWCAYRTHDFAALRRALPDALDYYAFAGRHRRLIELHLFGALAARDAGDFAASRASIARAETLLEGAAEPLIAGLADEWGADLPYLVGQANRLGLQVSTRGRWRGEVVVWPGRMFEQARVDYISFGHYASAAKTLRDRASWELDRGQVRDAAASLKASIEIDRARRLDSGLAQDMALVARLFERLGAHGELRDEVLEWLFERGTEGVFFVRSPKATLPTSKEQLEALLAEGDGRQQVLLALRAIRNDLGRASRPPDSLMTIFRELPTSSLERSRAFDVALEVGLMFAEQGETEQARRFLGAARSGIERQLEGLDDLDVRQAFLAKWRRAYVASIHQRVGVDTSRLPQRDYADALELVGQIKARGLLDMLGGGALPPLARSESTRADVIERVERALSLLASASASREEPPRAPSLPSLKRGEVMLEYLIAERSGYVWVIHPDGELAVRRVPGRRELSPLFEAFRERLIDHEYDGDDYAVNRELAERLYVALIGPVQDLIVDASTIYIAPDDFLHDLPFEALARPSRAKIPAFMIKDHTIRYTPSHKVLASLQARPGGGGRGALLFGAPALEQSALELLAMSRTLSGLEVTSLAELFPTLPGSEVELAAADRALRARGLDVVKVTGQDATESALAGMALSEFDIVHIASHGVSDALAWREGPGAELELSQPALLLARGDEDAEDGIAKLDEILRLEIGASLVILSGCTTGRGWEVLGDGAYGLGGAFLSAGARAVIASSWSVSDRATMKLIGRFYAHTKRHEPVEALRRAKLDMIRASYKGEAYTPPYYWAAFKFIGADAK